MGEVTLHGHWASPFSCRVIWALEIKGIAYEIIEEALPHKSDLLLQYNPVHKKIPVLVHAGKPICESMVILEYIEEIWPQNPLLPTHPYDRALARFWIKFAEDKTPSMGMIYRTVGEEQEKAIKDCVEMLQTMEGYGLENKKFFGGDKINMVDIAFGGIAHWLEVIEDAVGIKVFEANRFPRLSTWMNNFKQHQVIKDNLPDRDELFVFFKQRREMVLASK